MVTSDIPLHYTASPSSFSATPHLTINHEATIDLDSSNAFEGPEKLLEVWFSASADVLPATSQPLGLKAISAETWKEMLDLVNCSVLSIVNSEHVDAYLLSESSMFVFPHKLILKTCGTTTLLHGLPRILELARAIAGFPRLAGDLDTGIPGSATPYRVFYSRKNFQFPERQKGPHRSWRDEVRTLDRLFHGGSAYMIGKMNGDHWYLYVTEPNTLLTPPATPPPETEIKHLAIPAAQADQLCRGSAFDCQEDETLEILMTDLDKENSKQFYLDSANAVADSRHLERIQQVRKDTEKYPDSCESYGTRSLRDANLPQSEDSFDVFSNTSSENAEFAGLEEQAIPADATTEGHALGTVVSETCGLSDIYPVTKYPEARVDAYIFTPCGFSANGVIPVPGNAAATHYFTVHVTPEPVCSYASFETNVPCKQSGRETIELIEQVVNIFRPGRFSVTLFEAKQSSDGGYSVTDHRKSQKTGVSQASRIDSIKGYRRVERIVHDLEGYDLVFRYYERIGFEGGEPRLGEVFF